MSAAGNLTQKFVSYGRNPMTVNILPDGLGYEVVCRTSGGSFSTTSFLESDLADGRLVEERIRKVPT